MPEYVSPTGHEDPDSKWNVEENAYDGNVATSALSDDIPPETWGSFLVLTRPCTKTDKLRIRTAIPPDYVDLIDIDVYNVKTGAWEDEYDGIVGWGESYYPINLSSKKLISKARIRFHNAGPGTEGAALDEFQFQNYEYEANVDCVLTELEDEMETVTGFSDAQVFVHDFNVLTAYPSLVINLLNDTVSPQAAQQAHALHITITVFEGPTEDKSMSDLIAAMGNIIDKLDALKENGSFWPKCYITESILYAFAVINRVKSYVGVIPIIIWKKW